MTDKYERHWVFVCSHKDCDAISAYPTRTHGNAAALEAIINDGWTITTVRSTNKPTRTTVRCPVHPPERLP